MSTDTTFTDLGVPRSLADVLATLGITTPTPIQAATLPDSWAAVTSSDAAAPARARPTPSCFRWSRASPEPDRAGRAGPEA